MIRFFVLLLKLTYALAVSWSKIALFLANWSVFDCWERLPNSMFVANFKVFTSRREVVLFFLSFLFNLVTAMALRFIFLIYKNQEVESGFEPLYEVLQTSA